MGYINKSYLSTQFTNFATKIATVFAKKTDIGNGTITITQNGITKGTFTTNQSSNTTIKLTDSVSTSESKLVWNGESTIVWNE